MDSGIQPQKMEQAQEVAENLKLSSNLVSVFYSDLNLEQQNLAQFSKSNFYASKV